MRQSQLAAILGSEFHSSGNSPGSVTGHSVGGSSTSGVGSMSRSSSVSSRGDDVDRDDDVSYYINSVPEYFSDFKRNNRYA